MKYIRSIISVFGIAFIVAISGATAHAADPLMELTISPTDKHYTVNPGDTISDTATLLNSGQEAYDVTAYGAPYFVTGTNYTQNYSTNNANPRADAYKWLDVPDAKLHLEHRQTLEVPYTLKVPADTSPGGHYSILFFEVQPNADATGIVRKHRVGMVLYINVRGNVINKGSVESVKIPSFQTTVPLTSSVLVRNDGNTDFPAKSTYKVKNVFGRTLYESKTTHYILPGTRREIPFNWDSAPWLGLYQVNLSITVLGKTTTVSQYVLLMPVWLIVLVIIAIAAGGMYGLRRRAVRKSGKKKR